VALELIELTDQGVCEASGIARLLGRDPALSAEVLHQANSARFARRRDVSELDEALTLLGTDQTCRIAMSAACRGLVAPALGRPELRRCWEHSVAAAILAAALAPLFEQRPGHAYTAGLLHDIGCLALVAVYPDRYVEALRLTHEVGLPWLESECQTFGVDHCRVGGWVVDEWGLPEDLREIAVHHHDELPTQPTLVSLVAVADTLANLLQPDPIERPPWDEPADYLQTLPVEQARARELVDEAAERISAELE
jgi:putative nucleotidyltransferase with HDIG domain